MMLIKKFNLESETLVPNSSHLDWEKKMFWITPIISIYQRSQEKLIWHQKCLRKKRLQEKNIKRERDDNNSFFFRART